jgi:hypothetical protein
VLLPLKASGQATLPNDADSPDFFNPHQCIVHWGADALPLLREALGLPTSSWCRRRHRATSRGWSAAAAKRER